MSTFLVTLRSVRGSVYRTFTTEPVFEHWLDTVNSRCWPTQALADQQLSVLIARLSGSRWAHRVLPPLERGEIQGVVEEALTSCLGQQTGDRRRGHFAYVLAKTLLNIGRRYGRALSLPDNWQDPEFAAAENGTSEERVVDRILTRSELAHLDGVVRSYLERRRPSNEVASPDLVLRVKQIWLDAIRRTEAPPNSHTVRALIGRELDVDESVVEAAMKQLVRAVRKSMSPERDSSMRAWVVHEVVRSDSLDEG